MPVRPAREAKASLFQTRPVAPPKTVFNAFCVYNMDSHRQKGSAETEHDPAVVKVSPFSSFEREKNRSEILQT